MPEDLLPIGKRENDDLRKKENVIDKFFTVFKSWNYFSSDKAKEFVLHIDCERW